MRRPIDDKIINNTTYGSIPGRDPLEAMKALQYLYDNHRIMQKDLIVVFNNVAGCYDRIQPNQAEICGRRFGGNVNVLKTRTKIQKSMKQYICVSAGVSQNHIEWGETDVSGYSYTTLY